MTVIDRITEQWTRIDRLEIVILIGAPSVLVRQTSIRMTRHQKQVQVSPRDSGPDGGAEN